MLPEMLRRASFVPPFRAGVVFAMIGVAEVSPRLARMIGQAATVIRERLLARQLGSRTVLQWSPGN